MKQLCLAMIDNPWINSWIQSRLRPIAKHVSLIRMIAESSMYVSVLDYGCGEGLFCRAFDKAKYLGVDINDSKIRYAQWKHTGFAFTTGITHFTGVDLFFLNNVLHHLSAADLKLLVNKIQDEATPEARIILLEAHPVDEQPLFLSKIVLVIEALVHFSRPQSAQGWIDCFGPGFQVKQLINIDQCYLVELQKRKPSK